MDITSKISSIKYLENGLEAASLRQEVISNNIANVETPGFKKSVVAFESLLEDALRKEQISKYLHKTHDNHLPGKFKLPEPKLVTIKNTSMRNDLNNVDIDEEMALLAKNTIMFQALSEQLNNKFSGLKMVINGGR